MLGKGFARRSTVAVLLACAGIPCCVAFAQSPPAASDRAPVIDGLVLRAERAWVWSEGSTRRLLLTNDVRMSVSGRQFEARRAVIWIEPGQGGEQRVFAYLADFGEAASTSAISVSAKNLPVRVTLRPGQAIDLTTVKVTRQEPGAKDLPDDVRAVLAAGDEARERARRRDAGEPAERPLPLPVFRVPERHASAPLPPSPSLPLVKWPEPVAPPQSPPTPPAPSRTASAANPPRPMSPNLPPADTRSSPGQPPTPQPARPVSPAGAQAAAPVAPTPSTRTANAPAAPSAPAARPAPGPASPQPGAAPTGEPLFAREGVLAVSPGNVTLVPGEDENAVMMTGGVAVQYVPTQTGRPLQLSARRGVIFTDPGPLKSLANFDQSRVRGIYLEGEVTATDGEYTVRAPEVFYDLRLGKAVMLDAVFWTYDDQRQLPLYARAKTIRQTAAGTFTGEKAELTNSGFLDPELSLAASTVTITRREVPVARESLLSPTGTATRTSTWVEAEGITPRLMGVPFFYWPRYSGDPSQRVLKDVRFEFRSGSGGAILTTLNAYNLLGLKQPRSIAADLLLDYYMERGPGAGAKISWNDDRRQGAFFAYGLPSDSGTDVLKPGTEIERDGEFRGIVLAENRWKLDEDWSLITELAYISDETFVDAFFEPLGETRREFTNRLEARRLKDNTALSVQVEGSFNDFLANEYLLQSQGYSVTKLPEATYVRHADNVLPQHPGLLTWFSEYRVGRLELSFDEVSAAEHGFTNAFLSDRALGIAPGQSLDEILRAAGYREDAIWRGDTRQELALQTNLGPVQVNPFVVGRATYYDTSFEAYSPDEDDQTRLWGAAGLRVSTTVQRVYDDVDSRLLDIHRLRHIVEPNATFWVADTNVDRADLPVYDQNVEGIVEGGMMRAGVTQVFQTQRGGPGEWHSVDLLTISTDYMYSSGDTDPRGPIGRFFDDRPELSNPGEYILVDAVFRVTDALSISGSETYDADDGRQAAAAIGATIRQPPGYWAAMDLRYLDAQDATYLNAGFGYDLTDKYTVAVWANYDTDRSEFQSVAAEIRRRFQSMIVGVGVSTNEITGETGFGFVIRPYGAGGEAGITGLGSNGASSRVGGL